MAAASPDHRHAAYVGSFDPVTLGHEDIIRRGAKLFDRLTVGVGINPDKNPLFTPAERVDLIRTSLADLQNVTVQTFDGLAVDFARQAGAAALLRGVRSLMDIEAELTMSLTNRTLAPELETVFLMAHENLSHVSSSLIKQIARFGGPAVEPQLRRFVPASVVAPLLRKYAATPETATASK
ncbi:pantetheine-phosphate adenylyltransferase [Alienimonas chondri]|uniref:Phosphopantetheine adenylyltransferase n=1 Tax=Alienimonas chondri TaxID=2681879 RepID=A0ABX1VFB8_9PLAN|nr:pantetheine-phosphate adenylyltransferase [Alienimonas chondri]NNJ25741.1 Phosphopantetheine adenylyltransferase [Alienimonas chondri]